MKRSNATTLQDVAREAGVSAMTVSAVLNGSRSGTRVSEPTRLRVQEIAARMRYRVNGVARGLSRRRMDTLGVVAPFDGHVINFYLLEVLKGILEASAAHEQNTTILSISHGENDEPKILKFCDGRVDGVIFIGSTLKPAFAETLAHHVPFITINNAQTLRSIHDITVNNEHGAYLAVQHLIAQGHRRIAHFTGVLDSNDGQMRLTGYRRALSEAGLPQDEALVFPGDFNTESGPARISALLDSPGPRPTAIFCANDAVASSAIEVLNARGIAIPQEMSVVGFDDMVLARMTTPQLTTMRQPFHAMGQQSVNLLLHQINPAASEETPLAPSFTHVLDVKLIVRQTVGPPP
jgi:LacI family transcriptional regulator